MKPDDLVEKVARAMAVADGFDPYWITNNDTPDCPQPVWGLYKHSARAAIAVVLEEAAKVASRYSVEPGFTTNEHMMAHHIAAVIRAMKEFTHDR